MIYWDYNATTPLRPEVASGLVKALAETGDAPGNASSVHRGGRHWRTRLESARARVAKVLGCEPREVCFTSSGSEADALALKGAFLGRRDKARTRIVTSQIEHPAAMGALKQLESLGAKATRVPPRPDGQVDPERLIAELTPDVALCSLMWANNETGVLQPVAQVARACRERSILFHTDAVQAAGKVPVSLREVDAHLLSVSAHKFYGPAGIGALVVRRGVDLESLVPGHQEFGRRGGTSSVPYAESLANALELASAGLQEESARLSTLRDRFERELLSGVAGVRIHGASATRVPNTSSVEFIGADGEALLIALDLAGICVSSGAACASGSLSPSHVLTAMGLTSAQAHSCLRFSLGAGSSSAELEKVLEALRENVPKARQAAMAS
ncbi:MAG TPA: cysteine desulfurase family protein [Myxococcaceae bacterium]|nr:cysteine desulfurase family protein [Myxococcaceae bacterium]